MDQIDTRHAIRSLRRALHYAEKINWDPVLSVALTRHLRGALSILEDYAERQGFEVANEMKNV